jgi:hypothetical protein
MAGVLTEGSDVKCGHDPGKASPSSSALLKVGGKGVLRESEVKTSVSGCGTVNRSPTQADPTTDLKCSSITAVTGGKATKLMAGGNPVILDTLAGDTDGKKKDEPQKKVKGEAKQEKLTAV